MSFPRLIFYSAMVGGWAALAGWCVCEILLMRRAEQVGVFVMVLTAALVGGLIGGGLNFLAGAANGNWVQALPRLAIGFAAGLVGGALGCLLGNLIYVILPRALGWIVMGLGIGAVEGLTDLNTRKLRNGLIGGAVGGLLGGIFFDVIFWAIGNPMSSRAVALVLLGMCIGLSIGLAQVMLREAWLTVEVGFRPGRQMLLSKPETYLGTSEKAQLAFIAYGAKGVEPLHLCILRQSDGTFWVRDNGSRGGTFVNEQPVTDAVLLHNGDVIRLGINKVRFNERYRAAGSRPVAPPALPVVQPAVSMQQAIMAALPSGPPPAKAASSVPAPPVAAVAVEQAAPRQVFIPAAAPVAVAPASGVRGPAPVARQEAPPMAQATTPVREAAPSDQPARGPCPVCGRAAVGIPGKRRCDNCEIPF